MLLVRIVVISFNKLSLNKCCFANEHNDDNIGSNNNYAAGNNMPGRYVFNSGVGFE